MLKYYYLYQLLLYENTIRSNSSFEKQKKAITGNITERFQNNSEDHLYIKTDLKRCDGEKMEIFTENSEMKVGYPSFSVNKKMDQIKNYEQGTQLISKSKKHGKSQYAIIQHSRENENSTPALSDNSSIDVRREVKYS